jgi:hypothetical protein
MQCPRHLFMSLGLGVSLALLAALPSRAAPPTEFKVTGAVTTPKTYDYAALSALPAVTQTAVFLNGAISASSTPCSATSPT